MLKEKERMHMKMLLGLLITSILILSLTQFGGCDAQLTSQGWQVEDRGGFAAESNGIIHLWSNGGSDDPSISIYKQIKTAGDFTFSVQINAQTLESFGLCLRGTLPVWGSTDGLNFEFGHYGQGLFLLARNATAFDFYSFPNEASSAWTDSQVAIGDPNVWYTMQLSVSSTPFAVAASVLTEDGTLIGNFSVSDIPGFSFGDINYVGLSVWGFSASDYVFKNIQASFANPVSLTISTDSSSATAGSAVDVFGVLSDFKGAPFQNRTVVLSYTFPGADTWIPISSAYTNAQGNYNIQWINNASGTFTLKAEWSGDSSYFSVSNTTTLSFLPYQKQQVFLVESNSTIYDLAFNNETSTLSFNVTGPHETTGYVKATISKNLLTNGENLQVFIDGNQINYTVASGGDSWIVSFSYHHSTHQISMLIETNVSTVQPVGDSVILVAIVIVLGIVLIVGIESFLSHKDETAKNMKVSQETLT
jgi:hypothetical protein